MTGRHKCTLVLWTFIKLYGKVFWIELIISVANV